jgi:hypothetical protein
MVKRSQLRDRHVVVLDAGGLPMAWNAASPAKKLKERKRKILPDLPVGQERFTRDEVMQYGLYASHNLAHLIRYGYLTFVDGTVSRAELERARRCYEFIPADIRRGDW